MADGGGWAVCMQVATAADALVAVAGPAGVMAGVAAVGVVAVGVAGPVDQQTPGVVPTGNSKKKS